MSTETKKQSFIQEALTELSACATQFGFDQAELGTFEELASQLLKDSFKNGLKAAYRKQAKGQRKEEAAENSK